jgi:hypothetical protein
MSVCRSWGPYSLEVQNIADSQNSVSLSPQFHGQLVIRFVRIVLLLVSSNRIEHATLIQ